MADGVHGGLARYGWPPRYATMIAASVIYLDPSRRLIRVVVRHS